jgi:hypothetical protein
VGAESAEGEDEDGEEYMWGAPKVSKEPFYVKATATCFLFYSIWNVI